MFDNFDKVGNQTVLVIGDIILDKYIHGHTDRISPEAPVPIVLSQKVAYVLGGAANVASNISTLGAHSYIIGFIGNDTNGDKVLELAEKELGNVSGIVRSNKETTTKTRVVSKGQQILRIDNEDASAISITDEDRLYDLVLHALNSNEISGVILQDYNKGTLTEGLILKLQILFKEKGLPYFVDPKHENFWNYSGANVFKPNLSEIKRACGQESFKSLDEMLLFTAQKLNSKILMCTLAEEGLAYVENGTIYKVPTEKIDVIDVSGAGDSALSIIVLGYLLRYSTKDIATLANLCGKIVCMKSGVSTLTIAELKTAYESVY